MTDQELQRITRLEANQEHLMDDTKRIIEKLDDIAEDRAQVSLLESRVSAHDEEIRDIRDGQVWWKRTVVGSFAIAACSGIWAWMTRGG